MICRLLPDTDPEAFISNVQQAVNDDGISIEVRWPTEPPNFAPTDTSLFQAIESACLAHLPESLPAPSICAGGTDSRLGEVDAYVHAGGKLAVLVRFSSAQWPQRPWPD